MPRKPVSAYGVESRPPLRPTGVFLAVVRRRDRHRRAPGGANVDGLQAVAPASAGAGGARGRSPRRQPRRSAPRVAAREEGAEELVRDGPQLLFALLRFLCRPGRWSTRLKLQRPPEGSAQVDGNVAKIDLAARGVDGALVHFNAPSWAVRAVMSSTTLPVCPKTGSTSPSLTVHLCLHTAPGNRECAHLGWLRTGTGILIRDASTTRLIRPSAGCVCAQAIAAHTRPRDTNLPDRTAEDSHRRATEKIRFKGGAVRHASFAPDVRERLARSRCSAGLHDGLPT